MSIHKHNSFKVAQSKGAQAAHSFERWQYLTDMSKRELAEIVCHLAALCTDSYDETLSSDALLIARIQEERDALSACNLI